MHPNLQKLIKAGLLKEEDAAAFPAETLDRISALSEQDLDALIHVSRKLDPALLKSFNQFIVP